MGFGAYNDDALLSSIHAKTIVSRVAGKRRCCHDRDRKGQVIRLYANKQSAMMNNLIPLYYRYPYCIVWTAIPPITWFLPFVGHMGIADSNGVNRPCFL